MGLRYQLLITNMLLMTIAHILINIRVDTFGRQLYDTIMLIVVSTWGLAALINYVHLSKEERRAKHPYP